MTFKNVSGAVLYLSILTFAACDGDRNFSSDASPAKSENAREVESQIPIGTPTPAPTAIPSTTPTPTPIPPAFSAPTTPQQPKDGCQAHFSGILIGRSESSNAGISIPFQADQDSELVGAGFYSNSELAFPKAVASTFDGIAFDRDTKVTIYELPDFQGKILFERVGPVIVNQAVWRSSFESKLNPNWWAPRPNYGADSMLWLDMGLINGIFGRRSWDLGSIKIECRN